MSEDTKDTSVKHDFAPTALLGGDDSWSSSDDGDDEGAVAAAPAAAAASTSSPTTSTTTRTSKPAPQQQATTSAVAGKGTNTTTSSPTKSSPRRHVGAVARAPQAAAGRGSTSVATAKPTTSLQGTPGAHDSVATAVGSRGGRRSNGKRDVVDDEDDRVCDGDDGDAVDADDAAAVVDDAHGDSASPRRRAHDPTSPAVATAVAVATTPAPTEATAKALAFRLDTLNVDDDDDEGGGAVMANRMESIPDPFGIRPSQEALIGSGLHVEREGFHVYAFLSFMHRHTTFDQLRAGVKRLRATVATDDGRLRSLVEDNIDNFVNCTDTIGHVRSRIAAAEATDDEGSTSALKATLTSLTRRGTAVLGPMLQRQRRVARLRRVLHFLKRYHFVLALPQQMAHAMASRDYEVVTRLYQRVRRLRSQATTSPLFTGALASAANQVRDLRTQLVQRLRPAFTAARRPDVDEAMQLLTRLPPIRADGKGAAGGGAAVGGGGGGAAAAAVGDAPAVCVLVERQQRVLVSMLERVSAASQGSVGTRLGNVMHVVRKHWIPLWACVLARCAVAADVLPPRHVVGDEPAVADVAAVEAVAREWSRGIGVALRKRNSVDAAAAAATDGATRKHQHQQQLQQQQLQKKKQKKKATRIRGAAASAFSLTAGKGEAEPSTRRRFRRDKSLTTTAGGASFGPAGAKSVSPRTRARIEAKKRARAASVTALAGLGDIMDHVCASCVTILRRRASKRDSSRHRHRRHSVDDTSITTTAASTDVADVADDWADDDGRATSTTQTLMASRTAVTVLWATVQQLLASGVHPAFAYPLARLCGRVQRAVIAAQGRAAWRMTAALHHKETWTSFEPPPSSHTGGLITPLPRSFASVVHAYMAAVEEHAAAIRHTGSAAAQRHLCRLHLPTEAEVAQAAHDAVQRAVLGFADAMHALALSCGRPAPPLSEPRASGKHQLGHHEDAHASPVAQRLSVLRGQAVNKRGSSSPAAPGAAVAVDVTDESLLQTPSRSSSLSLSDDGIGAGLQGVDAEDAGGGGGGGDGFHGDFGFVGDASAALLSQSLLSHGFLLGSHESSMSGGGGGGARHDASGGGQRRTHMMDGSLSMTASTLGSLHASSVASVGFTVHDSDIGGGGGAGAGGGGGSDAIGVDVHTSSTSLPPHQRSSHGSDMLLLTVLSNCVYTKTTVIPALVEALTRRYGAASTPLTMATVTPVWDELEGIVMSLWVTQQSSALHEVVERGIVDDEALWNRHMIGPLSACSEWVDTVLLRFVHMHALVSFVAPESYVSSVAMKMVDALVASIGSSVNMVEVLESGGVHQLCLDITFVRHILSAHVSPTAAQRLQALLVHITRYSTRDPRPDPDLLSSLLDKCALNYQCWTRVTNGVE